MTYGNGLAPHDATYEFEGSSFLPDMLCRVVPAVLELRTVPGVTITVNQGYRWKGTLKDYQVGFEDKSADNSGAVKTSDGTANQFYQSGQAALYIASGGKYGTPSAATPGFSNHGDEKIGAIDCNCNNLAERDRVFRKYGLIRNIASETWHYANIGTPTVPIPSLAEVLKMIADNAIPTGPTAEDGEGTMAFTPEAEADLDRRFGAVTDKINALGVAVQLLVGLPENQQQFIAQITDAYQRNLGRGPDQAGLFGYLGLMVNQHWTIQQVDAAMSGSDEALGNQIAAWYRDPAILNRIPSPTEIQGWVSWLHANNQPLSAVRDQLIGSDEYKRLHP